MAESEPCDGEEKEERERLREAEELTRRYGEEGLGGGGQRNVLRDG